jgi:ABC-type Mn2+/Zn2+ transport system permease subunit
MGLDTLLGVGLLGACSGLLGTFAALRGKALAGDPLARGGALVACFAAGVVLGSASEGGLPPARVGLTAGVGLACLLAVLLLGKSWQLAAFDPDFARAQGRPTRALDLLLLGLIAVTAAAGVSALGVAQAAALLVLPAATARCWADRLRSLLLLAAAFGLALAAAGVAAGGPAAWRSVLPAGAALFAASLLLAPRRGLLARRRADRALRRRLDENRLLGALYDLTEPHLPARPAVAVADLAARGGWPPRRLLRLLAATARAGLLEHGGDAVALTGQGLHRAAIVARGRRLWELVLREYPDHGPGLADLGRESPEGLLPPGAVAVLCARLAAAGRLPAPRPLLPPPDGAIPPSRRPPA